MSLNRQLNKNPCAASAGECNTRCIYSTYSCVAAQEHTPRVACNYDDHHRLMLWTRLIDRRGRRWQKAIIYDLAQYGILPADTVSLLMSHYGLRGE